MLPKRWAADSGRAFWRFYGSEFNPALSSDRTLLLFRRNSQLERVIDALKF